MTNIALPEHLRRYPCMQPWIGSRYRDERHKRLLVVGESHFLPPDSTIHHDPARWYRSSQTDLSSEEVPLGIHHRQHHRQMVSRAPDLP